VILAGIEQLNADEAVSVDEMVSGSVDIPTYDYSAMVDAGIENPNAREYIGLDTMIMCEVHNTTDQRLKKIVHRYLCKGCPL